MTIAWSLTGGGTGTARDGSEGTGVTLATADGGEPLEAAGVEGMEGTADPADPGDGLEKEQQRCPGCQRAQAEACQAQAKMRLVLVGRRAQLETRQVLGAASDAGSNLGSRGSFRSSITD